MTLARNSSGLPLAPSLVQTAAEALPADASPAWQDLALSVVGLHPGGAPALRHAYDAAVDPLHFANIQLAISPGQEEADLPILSFGLKAEEPCRRFCSKGEIAPQPVFGPWSSEEAEAADWIMLVRAAGGRFQWLQLGDETVWLGAPVEGLEEVTALMDSLTPSARLQTVAIVKPILRANGGFF